MSRTDEQWEQTAVYVRHALNKLSVADYPLCLPGEPQECGQSAQHHALLWAADLKAAAQHLIETSAPSAENAAYYTGPVYEEALSTLRDQDVQRSA